MPQPRSRQSPGRVASGEKNCGPGRWRAGTIRKFAPDGKDEFRSVWRPGYNPELLSQPDRPVTSRQFLSSEPHVPLSLPASSAAESPATAPGAASGEAVDASDDSAGGSLLRQLLESVVCLAMAVIFFRAFILEGYIISTGSMAPHLLGYHKRIQCPDCEYEFTFGTAFDQAVPASQLARCPNCGENRIDVSKIPRNDGDQLLVFKYAYLNRDPLRWEIVVFLNPNNPTQAYVKRVTGLPGETIEVLDGDVLINGRLSRKPISIQRATRIAVFDHDHPAKSDDWLPRWLADGQWSRSGRSFVLGDGSESSSEEASASTAGSFGSRPLLAAAQTMPEQPLVSTPAEETGDWNWCHYLHWPRHVDRNAIVDGSVDPTDVTPAPISDRYGYNRISGSLGEYTVHDLMWTGQVRLGKTGQFSVVVHNRDRWGVCILDVDRARLDAWVLPDGQLDRPFDDPTFKPHASIPLRGEWMTPEVNLEVSCFDYQMCVAVNGHSLIEQPFETAGLVPQQKLPPSQSAQPDTVAGYRPGDASPTGAIEQTASFRHEADEDSTPSRIHFGGRNGTFLVRDLTIFRDVHYTTSQGSHAVGKPYSLGDDEFFFLGDNSPVSLDSRGWRDPVVPRHLIVGKPIVVHLPSKPGRIRIGGREWFFRVPDFSRIRYIR